MSIETLSSQDQEFLSTNKADDQIPEQTVEITSLPPECFHLVGGGEGIVVL